MLKSILTRLLAASIAIAAFGPLHAQTSGGAPNMAQMGNQVATFSGSMHAAAEVCGGYTKDQLADMKAKQKQQMTKMGLTAQEFDTAFDTGKKKTDERWDTMSKAEQKSACEELRQQMSQAFNGMIK
ncbi:Putative lipoprotein [Alloalcanivorax dieselolei B5]|uniref:Putative lipoprotein n=1 Tax=Alcanivorax dieselolei (strain DSM 16502 / CGMCC 1.3690 / MCCC 1A00001 / B-5) TaxID=930169 RepID=K0CD98_ALCDB|nr:hypothetical protein [Alloalcanivorax dieselolei]AFT71579.1 Putative lipoprotein [Alloalcanivorax dieselolei B5]GGJ89786.1 lipoprotein [Alloalcanivorax dieselolei]